MLKRLFTPLTLVNQLALIVLLATIIGVAGMAIIRPPGAWSAGQRPRH